MMRPFQRGSIIVGKTQWVTRLVKITQINYASWYIEWAISTLMSYTLVWSTKTPLGTGSIEEHVFKAQVGVKNQTQGCVLIGCWNGIKQRNFWIPYPVRYPASIPISSQLTWRLDSFVTLEKTDKFHLSFSDRRVSLMGFGLAVWSPCPPRPTHFTFHFTFCLGYIWRWLRKTGIRPRLVAVVTH